MLDGHPFSLCRALSEAEPKTKAELSASQFRTLNECELKAKQEFSERNKQSIVKPSIVKPSRRRRLNLSAEVTLEIPWD